MKIELIQIVNGQDGGHTPQHHFDDVKSSRTIQMNIRKDPATSPIKSQTYIDLPKIIDGTQIKKLDECRSSAINKGGLTAPNGLRNDLRNQKKDLHYNDQKSNKESHRPPL